MGLDMYLWAKKYVGGWDYSSESEKSRYEALIKASGLTPTKDSPSFRVCATVGYWRKANAVHRWFVDNVQDGRDECQESPVSREQLLALRDACAKVLDTAEMVDGMVESGRTWHPDGRVEVHTKPGKVIAQPDIAAATMPTQGGFFFGSTDYDEYYLSDLRGTVEIIDRVLADKALEDCEFFYRASW